MVLKLNNKKNYRIEWLDIAKGIAIILVVMGHSPTTYGIKNIIYSFHIPLFFFLSGFILNQQKYPDLKCFVKHKIKTIVIPYFLFSFIEYLVYKLWENNVYKTNYSTFSILKGIFIASGSTLKIDTVLWFLPCLFIVSIAFFLITKLTLKINIILKFLILFSISGFFISSYIHVRLPWFIDSSLTAIVFYGLGFIFKKYDSIFESKLSNWYTEVLIFSFILLYFFSVLNSNVDMFGLVYNNYFYYYISAICGILCCIIMSKMIKKSKTLSYIGKNTIIVFAFHPNMFVIINYILGFIKNHLKIHFLVMSTIKWSLLYTFLSITLLIPLIIIVNKCSFLTKRKTPV